MGDDWFDITTTVGVQWGVIDVNERCTMVSAHHSYKPINAQLELRIML